jgi:hypothetical protein
VLKTFVAAAMLAISAPLLAQTGAERRIDCSKAKDPKACEERLAKARAAHAKARAACEGRTGTEGRDCMRREMCAQTKDPARCEAQVKEGAARRAKIREACRGKAGEELRSCIREQRGKK